MTTISVVIPAWQAAGTLARAIDSVLRQTSSVDEIIVVDDGSTDSTEEVARGYTPHVTYIRQANLGAAAARNRGVDVARGDFVGFLDADDEWLPVRVENQRHAIALHPEIGFLAGPFLSKSPWRGVPTTTKPPHARTDRVLQLGIEEAWETAMRTSTITVLIRRRLAAQLRFREDLQTAEDRELWVRAMSDSPSWISSVPLAVQHVIPGSLSLRDLDSDCRNMHHVIELHASGTHPSVVRQREAANFRRWAGVLLAAGRARDARVPALQRLRRQPLAPEAWFVALRALVAGAWR